MPSLSDYLDDWKGLVSDGIRSYMDVVRDIRRERSYHRQRSMESPDDRDAADRVPRLEIPLLWGSF